MFRARSSKTISVASIAALILYFLNNEAFAAGAALPDISINIGGSEIANKGELASSIKIVLLLTALSFAPAMMLTMTSFTRIAVVLGMTRTALGTQQMPPNMVITGLALFLTMSIMNPVFQKMYDNGLKPYLDGQMSDEEAITKTFEPLKHFFRGTRRYSRHLNACRYSCFCS